MRVYPNDQTMQGLHSLYHAQNSGVGTRSFLMVV